MTGRRSDQRTGGTVGWAVRNPVAVNLLMVAIIVAGFASWFSLVREVLPNSDPEQIVITVAYPGATPDEVEKSIALRIEREIRGVSGIDEIASEILEGVCAVRVSLDAGVDQDRLLNELRNEIDRVKPDLPEGSKEPEITALRPFFPVISVYVYGDVAEERLREAAQNVRDDLVDLPDISEVTVAGTREKEIWIEILPEKLEEHRLTFGEVGRAISAGNLDLPGGQLESATGNVRVRTMGEEDRALDLEKLVVRARPDGSLIRLSDIATLRETFEDKIEKGRFNGLPAAAITVFKTPEQDAIDIADTVKAYVADNPTMVGGAIRVEAASDLSRFVVQRLDLMFRNARMGLILVCIALALFLDARIAFWVALGLPVAFLGTFVLMYVTGMTVNLISLFGLIVVLGLIVDDAIVIAENVFTRTRQGVPLARAAIEGTREVGLPVLAAVMTSVAAFGPLAFLSGTLGTFLKQLPLVVIAALAVSLVEAFIILPAHLGHEGAVSKAVGWITRFFSFGGRVQRMRAWLLEETLPDLLERLLRFVLRWRYVSMTALFSFSLALVGTLAGGIVPFVLIQSMDAENVSIDIEMAAGTPVEVTEAVLSEIEGHVLAQAEVDSAFSVVGSSFSERGRESAADPATVAQVNIEMLAADDREAQGLRTSKDVVAELRDLTAEIPGVAKMSFIERGGGPQGVDLEIRVRGSDIETLERAVAHVRDVVSSYQGVYELEDDLAVQMRNAFFGNEAQDLQESDGEVTVRVVLPESARTSLADLGRLRVATPAGKRVPLEEVAHVETGRGYASLARVDGQRAITVKASVDEAVANVRGVTAGIAEDLTDIGARYPGVSVSFEGQQKRTAESVGSLKFLFPLALLVIYGILATVFRSYLQPFLVMAAIPYAFVGALIGHLFMGLPFTRAGRRRRRDTLASP